VLSIVDIEQSLTFLKNTYGELEKSEILHFQDFVDVKTYRSKRIKSNPELKRFESAGCYVIYELDKPDRPLYIGSAGKNHGLRNRMMNDLFSYSQTSINTNHDPFFHSLTQKLTKSKEHGTIDAVRDFYLNNCYFKIVKTDNLAQAIALEGFLILALRPRYNKEILEE